MLFIIILLFAVVTVILLSLAINMIEFISCQSPEILDDDDDFDIPLNKKEPPD